MDKAISVSYEKFASRVNINISSHPLSPYPVRVFALSVNMQSAIPYLAGSPTSTQLIVHGEPFLMLAAELQNSALTSAKYMREVWPKLVATNINTILGCVTWEQIEPIEGRFNFEDLDEVIKDARSHGLRLVLLWFGSFKNGMRCSS